jgi:hypothetical protein
MDCNSYIANTNSSFYLDQDTPNNDAKKNLNHPFVLSIVSVFSEVLTPKQLDKLNYYATLIWDKYYDSDEDRAIMNEIPGGEQLLHVMMNMKCFVQTLKTKISTMEEETYTEKSPSLDQHNSKRIRND